MTSWAIDLASGMDDEAFAVVGVHSPKFPAQRDPHLVSEAVRRLGITHPQVLDPDTEITSSFGVRGWPTLVVVGERDWRTPPSASRTIAAGIPRAELRVLPGVGHFFE